jgi:hypothetical protein
VSHRRCSLCTSAALEAGHLSPVLTASGRLRYAVTRSERGVKGQSAGAKTAKESRVGRLLLGRLGLSFPGCKPTRCDGFTSFKVFFSPGGGR